MSKHTPTPWQHTSDRFPTSIWANDVWIASTNVETAGGMERREANAEYIVKAVNAHEELVQVVTGLLHIIGRPNFSLHDPVVHAVMARAEAALEKAGQK